MAIPMQQREFKAMIPCSRRDRAEFYNQRLNQWDGSKGSMIMKSALDDSPEQRLKEFDRLWNEGGFAFWTSNYMDTFSNKDSNRLIYQYWRDRVRAKVQDPVKARILAPDEPPYAFGTKRVPLEQHYYEAFNLDHVNVVDLNADGIKERRSNGLVMDSGTHFEFDVVVLATGFDMSTGSFDNINIHGNDGQMLKQKWSTRTQTYLGLCVHGFPNMLFSYGPQSPSNTCNGPVCAEVAGTWIIGLLENLKKTGKTRVEAKVEAETQYTDLIAGMLKGSLFEGTKSFYFGDNIPHQPRRREPLFWMGGLPAYREKLKTVADDGYAGFDIA
jgi:cation diffusion facilitator CzcD-associated flavoprotein CzcO